MAPLIQVIVGTTRPGRFSEKAAAWVTDRLTKRTDLELEVVDLRDHPLPIFDATVQPARAQRQYADDRVTEWSRVIDRADGYIIVTAEYNHGYPSVLKNAMDFVFPEFNRKPVAFVGYGGVGGARAIEQLRLVAITFEMAALPHAVHILPDVLAPVMRADEFSVEMFAALDGRLTKLADDLLWWTNTLSAGRAITD